MLQKSLFLFLFMVGHFATAELEVFNFTKVQSLIAPKIINADGHSFILKPHHSNGILSTSNQKNRADSITVGVPLSLMGESFIFGGVVTKVSDSQSEELGNLKLSQIEGPVRMELVNTTNKQAVVLKGHFGGGKETDDPEVLLEVPILNINSDTNSVDLDLSSIGEKMDIAYYLNSHNEDELKFVHKSSRVSAVDYSLKTLVFDVESFYDVPTMGPDKSETYKPVIITTRWFLRLTSALSPFFESRKNTEGVGYYEAGESHKYISRFSIYDLKNNPIKYYLKNIPIEHRSAILSGFENWNHSLQSVLNHELFVYEFIEKSDPRYDQIVTGDVRYNVLEWDIDNKASYGGLGPSVKNDLTGETLAGHVLIQGPKIVEYYKGWFKYKEQSAVLNKQLGFSETQILERQFLQKIINDFNQKPIKFFIQFGSKEMYVPGQDPMLQDAFAINPMDYLETPEGYSYETYMNGYWREIIAHELGHNLGLKHNFRGNLKDDGSGNVGSVSRSVMEYLPRTHRHLNRVSEYDVMAISYGYLGVQPVHKDWFCTDENQGVYSYKNSAECSSLDATNDPVTFFEKRINRGLDLLLGRNYSKASEWTLKDVWGSMNPFIKALSAYAYTAPLTTKNWTHFFGKEGRPQKEEDVPGYILKKLNGFICDSSLDEVANDKSSTEDQIKTAETLADYRRACFDLLKKVPAPWSIVNKQNFPCYSE